MVRKSISFKRSLLIFLTGATARLVLLLYNNFEVNQLSSNSNCINCQNSISCPSEKVEFDPQPPLDVPRTMYKPKGMYEVIRWTQFDENFISDIINDEPQIKMNDYWKEEYQAISQVALQYINSLTNQTWKVFKLQNGYIKHDALQGTHYILDLDLVKNRQDYANICPIKRRFRIELVHYLMPIESSKSTITVIDSKLDLKVFLFVTLGSTKIQKFLEKFPGSSSQNTEIYIIAVTRDKNKDFTKIKQLQDLVNGVIRDGIKINFLVKDESFGRVVILNNIIATETKEKDIVLLLTEDVIIKQSLVNHCKIFSKPYERVYFPVAFGQFTSDLVIKGMPPGKSKEIDLEDHNKFTGQWLPYNYDFSCAYANDIKSALSHLLTVHNIIEENEFGKMLNEQFMKQDIEIIRSVSPGLYKDSKNERCLYDDEYASKYKQFCLHEKVMGLASKAALGVLYLTDIEKKQN